MLYVNAFHYAKPIVSVDKDKHVSVRLTQSNKKTKTRRALQNKAKQTITRATPEHVTPEQVTPVHQKNASWQFSPGHITSGKIRPSTKSHKANF